VLGQQEDVVQALLFFDDHAKAKAEAEAGRCAYAPG